MHLLLIAMLLALPSATRGAEPDTLGPQPGERAPQDGAPGARPPLAPHGEAPRPKLLGAQLSAGAPQGFVASAVVRPVRWLRGTLGFAHNVIGPGIQGSVTAIPFHSAVAPTVTLEAGHFFETDVSDRLSEFPGVFDASLRRFGYDFYSAQLGLEIGSQRGLLFFLRGGVAWMRSGLDAVEGFRPDGRSTTVDASGLKLRAAAPTVNLGCTFYVW
jgi:hypothetical protein